jgi:hypothetical protein
LSKDTLPFFFDNLLGGFIPGTDELPNMSNSVSVLWFSRHPMTQEQFSALESKLGAITVTQIDGTMQNVHVPFLSKVNGEEEVEVPPFKELISSFDIIAIVAPINLQQQILQVAGDRPVIMAKSNRVRKEVPEGQPEEFEFIFDHWYQLIKIEVITEEFAR